MWFWIVCALFVSVGSINFNNGDQLQSDEIIDAVNAAGTTWKAGRNFHPSLKENYIKNLFGVIKKPSSDRIGKLLKGKDDESNDVEYPDLDVPKNFDAREKWKFCNSLQEVRDQGSCGSCWAVATAAAFTDRLCIATNGSLNGHLSAQHLMSCCFYCGDGCKGGSPAFAWLYLQERGIVTGGDYKSNEGCQPYVIPECEHYVAGPRNRCSKDFLPFYTPCKKQCYNQYYTTEEFQHDHHKVKFAFTLSSTDFTAEANSRLLTTIKREIYKSGPVTTTFDVHEDFLAYKSGVYQHITGKTLFGHAVKIIGWGEEEGTPYWLVANSWNSDWGDKGFFKIKRGSNECGIEQEFQGGIVKV